MSDKIKVIRDGEEVEYDIISKEEIMKASKRISETMNELRWEYRKKLAATKKAIRNIYLNA